MKFSQEIVHHFIKMQRLTLCRKSQAAICLVERDY